MIQSLKDGQHRHPRRDRRCRARAGRRAHQPCAELRHPVRHRKLRAPHRPHRPRRAQRRSDPVRGAARARHARRDRARHAAEDRADAVAERRCRQRTARRQVPRQDRRGAGKRAICRLFRELVERYEREHDVPAVDIAAALAKLVQGKTPLLLQAPPERPRFERDERAPRERPALRSRRRRAATMRALRVRHAARHGALRSPRRPVQQPQPMPAKRCSATKPRRHAPRARCARKSAWKHSASKSATRMACSPATSSVRSPTRPISRASYIGRIDIRDDYSLVDLPEGMPRELMEHLKKVRVAGQPLRIQRAAPATPKRAGRRPAPARRTSRRAAARR